MNKRRLSESLESTLEDPYAIFVFAMNAAQTREKEALSSQTFVKADEISLHELGFPIPKAKYPNLEEAMLKSRDSVYVVFDKSGRFERAIPDTLRGK